MIIEALREIHAKHRLNDGDVSAHTKSAQRITKEWQNAVCSSQLRPEVRVSHSNNEKIDIVDLSNLIAYELKVSGKNTHHEFYKDLIKVLTYNEYADPGKKLKRLVFVSELSGINSLQGRLDKKFIQMLKNTHGLSIELVSI
ncbi:hypothetical protein [Gimesia panareensis]|uniref:hypothetical protein n=1 Tax=Gimesia panareensis TaxID=2527978 RepID=UPI001189F0AC|nr:hypothetical protein [Gimesia panareensis]QDU47945.1 hypothetical protein Pan110_02570 [Gimesia panareensis]